MKTNNKQIINTFYGVILVSFFAFIATIIAEFDIFLTFSKKSKNQILHSTNPFIKGF